MARDHFEKHSQQAGRVEWNFNLTFEANPDVTRLAVEYANALNHPGLYDPVPPRWLHATILRVGFVSDFTEAEMLATVKLLRSELAGYQVPELVCDSWWLWGGNVVVHLTPEDSLTAIYDLLIDCLVRVVGAERAPTDCARSFIPHITLAYTRTHNQDIAINDRLAHAAVTPARISVASVALLRQWPTEGHYEWDVVEHVSLPAVDH